MPIAAATEDFFRLRLDHMIDLRHALAVLASRMPWQHIEASVSYLFSGKVRAGKKLPGIDLFGEQIQLTAVKSNAGRPRVPLRTMIALLYLKHTFNESDEAVVQRWSETPVWQYFGGRAYFDQTLPCDATTLVKFRALLGEEGVEQLLSQIITAALDMKLISPKELATVVVDSTVQPKAVAHPTDSKLLETARQKLVQAAKDSGIDLKQTFAKEGQLLRFKAGRYAHAKQFKRMARTIKCQRTIVARIARQIERGASVLSQAVRDTLHSSLAKARQIVAQAASRKNTSSTSKLYAWHAPEVECIGKGKSRTPYEFGVKADHRMQRCYLKGEQGDRLNAVLCAAGYNIKWLLRMIAKKGVSFLQRLYLRMCEAAGVTPHWPEVLRELVQASSRMNCLRIAGV